jgi:hypothetical protein
VGELTRAPAVAGSVRDVDVDDSGSPGTGGDSWIGFNRRRASAASVGSDVAIGWRQ